MARPTKFDRRRARSALLQMRAGEPRESVARGAGVSLRTLQGWLARGRAGEEPFAAWARDFDLAVESHRRARVRRHWERYNAEAKERWRAFRASRVAWWLGRLGPAEFWRRRLAWMAERGHWVAYDRAVAMLRERGYCRNVTP